MRMIDRRKPTLESVIMHIATQFINVLPEDFSSQLNESLGIIGEFLKVDRVYVFEYDFDNNITNNTYEWCATDVEPQIDYLQKVPIDMILHTGLIVIKMDKWWFMKMLWHWIKKTWSIKYLNHKGFYPFVRFHFFIKTSSWALLDSMIFA